MLRDADSQLWHAGFLGAACRLLSCGMHAGPGLQPGVEPRPPVLGAYSLTYWTAREVPGWPDLKPEKMLPASMQLTGMHSIPPYAAFTLPSQAYNTLV